MANFANLKFLTSILETKNWSLRKNDEKFQQSKMLLYVHVIIKNFETELNYLFPSSSFMISLNIRRKLQSASSVHYVQRKTFREIFLSSFMNKCGNEFSNGKLFTQNFSILEWKNVASQLKKKDRSIPIIAF